MSKKTNPPTNKSRGKAPKKIEPIDWGTANLMTTVDLSYQAPDGNDVYHFLYASQLYGTLFAVYGKFTTDPNLPLTGPKTTVTGLSLQLFNYQGVVNIGFANQGRPYYFCPKDPNAVSSIDRVYFGVQAGMNNNLSLDFKINISLQAKKTTTLNFTRFLYPMADYKFDINKRANQVPDKELSEQDPKIKIPNSPTFDTEFQHRAGIAYYNRVLRSGLAADPDLSVQDLVTHYPEPLQESFALVPPFITARCTQSTLNLVYY